MRDVSEIVSVGLAHELVITACKAGFTPAELGALAKNENFLREVRRAYLGFAEITQVEHLIDCDADPFVPDGWTVEEHQKSAALTWDKSAQATALFLSEPQKRGRWIEGNKLRSSLKLREPPVLNANVLDYLLKHPHLIPEEWKGKAVFFWGTIYRDSGGNLIVRCLSWNGSEWGWYCRWLVSEFGADNPAALRAS